ncbi:MAG: hypothetical protein A3I05_02105 [Deltaproteobacteria bacterium RIFCSPLOWO2_02_FULL_44_10]|nr:MAG: hypothetical protein A3C46_08275 [Deltaproteobacteria bacterium RIFCSPHIGHO2_02_FULL_44_16]OGQ47571.1 MAG: hypothetical protein A3I05_02105 [Deltaproteobacteria bacterium RIFCSPLOWO2_02_FULL_44_10]
MKKLLSGTILLTFVLFLWGALVRSTGSGLACPDWPLCHGQFIPPMELPIFLEWGHRIIATIVGAGALSILLVAFRKRYRKELGAIAILSFVLLLIQAGLGGAAIFTALAPYVVSIHLGVGTLFLTTLLWMRLRLVGNGVPKLLRIFSQGTSEGGASMPYEIKAPTETEAVRSVTASSRSPRENAKTVWFIGATLLVYLQLILGGFVASSHAGLACPDFPKCFGEWIPPLEGAVALHFWHRIMAYVIFIMVTLTVILTLQKKPTKKGRILLFLIFGSMMLQVLLGIINVLFALPMSVRVSHLGMGTILYALLFITAYEAQRVRLFESH